MTTTSFRAHLRREWQFAPRRAPLLLTLFGAAGVALVHLIFPRIPPRVITFMERGFRLEDLAGVMLLNDLMSVYFATFLVGLFGSIGVVLTAREERRLELLLAKPVRAADFVAARLFPALAWTVVAGAAISGVSALALAAHAGAGTSVTPAGAFGGGLALTAIVIAQIAALQLVFVRTRDPFQGLMIACAVWLATNMPTAVLLYRPDVFAGRDALASAVLMPSLLWHDATAAWLGPLLLAASLPIAALLVRAAGALLERSDAT